MQLRADLRPSPPTERWSSISISTISAGAEPDAHPIAHPSCVGTLANRRACRLGPQAALLTSMQFPRPGLLALAVLVSFAVTAPPAHAARRKVIIDQDAF